MIRVHCPRAPEKEGKGWNSWNHTLHTTTIRQVPFEKVSTTSSLGCKHRTRHVHSDGDCMTATVLSESCRGMMHVYMGEIQVARPRPNP